MLDESVRLLNNVFGYQSFRGLQEDIIAWALEGRRLIGFDADGWREVALLSNPLHGSSLAQVWWFLPLIALMQDQVTTLQQLGD